MTEKRAIDRLTEIRAQVILIRQNLFRLLDKRQELDANRYPGAIRYDDTGGSRPSPRDKLCDDTVELEACDERIAELKDRWFELIEEVASLCDEAGLSDQDRQIVVFRVAYAQSWSVVQANATGNLSKTSILRHYDQAEKKIKNFSKRCYQTE